VRWLPPRVSSQGPAQYPTGYGDDFLANSPIVFLECSKP
jgi:hypothetical protein